MNRIIRYFRNMGVTTRLSCIWSLIALLAFIVGIMVSNDNCEPCEQEECPQVVVETMPTITHTVVYGEDLDTIGKHYGVPWREIYELNEEMLVREVRQICKERQSMMRDDRYRRNAFCNRRYDEPIANTLWAGWKIQIPVPNKQVAQN